MKIAMRYFTKSKKGNTEKIAKFIEDKTEVKALDVSHPLEEEVEMLLLVNAMYAADVDNEIKKFLKENKEKIKCLINVNSSASGKSTLKAVKKVCDKEGIKILAYLPFVKGDYIKNVNKLLDDKLLEDAK